MESSTGVNSIKGDNGAAALKHCVDLVNMLAGRGPSFSISVKIENSFVFQLQSGKEAATASKKTKRAPSYKRRQERRKLLKKKLDTIREKSVNTSDTVSSTEEALPDTVSFTEEAPPDTVSSTEESPPEMSAAASGSPLNLCPKPVYPRTSEGSMDSEVETKDNDKVAQVANKVRFQDVFEDGTVFDKYDYEHWLLEFSLLASDNGHDVGWAKEGNTCAKCSKAIRHCRWRIYPNQCGNCWRASVKLDPKCPFGFFDSIEAEGDENDSPAYVKWLLSL